MSALVKKEGEQIQELGRKEASTHILGNFLFTLCKNIRRECKRLKITFSSGQFSCSVVSNSMPSHGLQHARPPCPSLTPGFYSTSCPLSWWCHPTISVTWSQLIPRGTQDDQSPWWCRRTIKETERTQSLRTVSHLQKHDPATKAASHWSQSWRSPENRATAGLLLFQKFLLSWVHLENLTHLKNKVWWVFTNWTSLPNQH